MSYFGLAEYKEAAARLKPLADAQPDNTELSYLLAKCYVWSGDEAAAAPQLFQKLLERDPDSAAVHMLMGEALDSQNHTEDAIKEFELPPRTHLPNPMSTSVSAISIGNRNVMTTPRANSI